MDTLRASSNLDPSAGVDGIRVFGMNSYKSVEAIMQSGANGEVICLGLRRFFFLSDLIVVLLFIIVFFFFSFN